MAISDNKLDDFFGKQKVGSTSALAGKRKQSTEKRKTTTPKTNKPIANRKHTVSKPLADREQTNSKPIANRKHTVSKPLANREQTSSKPVAEPLAQVIPEIQFLDVKLHDFSVREKECLNLIFWKCHSNGSLESPPIYTQEIVQKLVITSNRVRNIINRILKKGGVKIKEFSAGGRNAYRVFALSKNLYQAMLAENINNQIEGNGVKPLAEPLATNAPLSSSNYNITTTKSSLPQEWLEIDVEPLRHLGFSENHLTQLQRQTELLPDVVQKSINCFAFDLETNNKKASIKGSPLNYFMGILRKIGAYNAPENYESPKDKALREMVEQEERQKAKRNEHVKKIKSIEFEKWLESKTNEELTAIEPRAVKEGRDRLSGMTLGALYPVFEEEVWSSKRKEIAEILGEEI